MNNPATNLYLSLIDKIQQAIPTIRYIAQDFGQLEYYELRPAIGFPAVLIDIGAQLYTDASHSVQLATSTVTLRLAMGSYSDNSNITPAQVRAKAMEYYELEHALSQALHNWQPPHEAIGALTRTTTDTEKREDDIRVRAITFAVSMQYDGDAPYQQLPAIIQLINQ
jgi:hypothetical protein